MFKLPKFQSYSGKYSGLYATLKKCTELNCYSVKSSSLEWSLTATIKEWGAEGLFTRSHGYINFEPEMAKEFIRLYETELADKKAKAEKEKKGYKSPLAPYKELPYSSQGEVRLAHKNEQPRKWPR